MRNYIILNGKNSNEINGLLIQELPPISKPLIRTEVEEIDGRDGDIVTPLGYSAYDKELTIGLYKDFDVNEVAAYFNSEGTVIFSNEPDKYYYYQITAQIDFERLVRYRTATVTMHCQPFKYSATEQPITEDVSGTVSDEGTNLALENTAEAPFSQFDLKGNTEQTTYSGKNLCPLIASTTNKGITYTQNADGTYNISGTSTAQANAVLWLDDISAFVDGQTYTISASPAPTNVSVLVEVYNGTTWLRNGNVATGETPSQPKVLDLTNADRLKFTLRVGNGKTVNLSGLKIQLEKGSTATAWERYVGGTASPNPDYPQAVQTVTGENVVKICTKNIFDGETINAWLRPDGTAQNSNGDRTSANYISVKPNTTYTLHGTLSTYLKFTQFDSSKTAVSQQTTTSATSLTVTTGVTTAFIRIGWGNAANASDVMLELGSTATAYEPYQGQSYEVNLGKNLFDKSAATLGYRMGATGEPYADANYNLSDYIAVQPSTSYTYSRYKAVARAESSGIAYYASDKTFISRYIWGASISTYTATTPSNAYYVRIFDNKTVLDQMQFEKGSQATSYADYFTPIELCKIGDYQDYIYKSGDKWYLHKAVGAYTFSSADGWRMPNQSTYPHLFQADNIAALGLDSGYTSSSLGAGALCAKLVFRNSTDVRANEGFALYNSGSWQTARVCNNSLSSTSDLDTWLANGDVKVYYVLATPTDTTITNTALIEQLDDIYYHAHAYKGRTHITSSAATGNVPHIIAAEVGEDNESTITNAGNYLSKPKITVYGSGDISLYINDMHVLQITLGDEGYITIDTAQMEAYKDTLDNLKNRLVIGDYSNARLKPGANKIHFTGTVTKYVVENYSRWL